MFSQVVLTEAEASSRAYPSLVSSREVELGGEWLPRVAAGHVIAGMEI